MSTKMARMGSNPCPDQPEKYSGTEVAVILKARRFLYRSAIAALYANLS